MRQLCQNGRQLELNSTCKYPNAKIMKFKYSLDKSTRIDLIPLNKLFGSDAEVN